MKRGVWLGGLVLSMGGWLTRLDAQDRVWHAVARQPTPVVLTGTELLPCPVGPAAALGRPVVIATAQPVAPATAGTAEVKPVSYQPPAPPEELPVSATDSTALTKPPTWPELAENTPDQSALIDQVSLFASDRSASADGNVDLLRVGSEPEPAPVPKKTTEKIPAALPVEIDPASLFHPRAVDGPMPDPLHAHFYVKGEYLLWGIRPYHVPPLVTTGSVNDNSQVAGVLGQPNTRVLFGNSNLGGDARSGLRLTVGGWCDMWEENGFEASGFFLGEKKNTFFTNSAQNAVIARPFFDLNNSREFREIVSFPGLVTGSVAINAPSRFFGFETDYRGKLCCGCDYRVDMLAGFRFLDLDEDLNITEKLMLGNSASLGNLANQNATAFDDFHTKNRFYGGQVGVVGEKRWGAWSLEGRLKLALGATSEEVSINGSQQFSPNSALNARGDLLALQSNIGSTTRTRFAVVPELDLNIGYQINEHVRAFIGYNFLYWSSVVRPGDQIDRVLDVATIPNFAVNPPATVTGQGRPAAPFKESDFWAQGLNVGIEFRY